MEKTRQFLTIDENIKEKRVKFSQPSHYYHHFHQQKLKSIGSTVLLSPHLISAIQLKATLVQNLTGKFYTYIHPYTHTITSDADSMALPYYKLTD